MTERAQKLFDSFVKDTWPSRGSVARLLVEAAQTILPDDSEHPNGNPSGKFVGWKKDLLQLAQEIRDLP